VIAPQKIVSLLLAVTTAALIANPAIADTRKLVQDIGVAVS
jgi:hypothetical protein